MSRLSQSLGGPQMTPDEIRETIKDCDRMHRDANVRAMRSKGWKKVINLRFAAFASWVGDWAREIERDEQRGKDDTYHDEY